MGRRMPTEHGSQRHRKAHRLGFVLAICLRAPAYSDRFGDLNGGAVFISVFFWEHFFSFLFPLALNYR